MASSAGPHRQRQFPSLERRCYSARPCWEHAFSDAGIRLIPPPKTIIMKLTSPPAMCLIALIALTSAMQAGYITGSINFSSSPDGGIILQDSGENVTTNLAAAAGIKEWSLTEVEEGSGSFDTVVNGTAVSFLQPWLFDPLASTTPLWKIAGPEEFTFNLTSSATVYQSPYFLAIRGTGMLTGNGFEDTPATWWFTTQGVAAENKFSWSSSTVAVGVPDGGSTIILLGGSLLGLIGFRHWFKAFCLSPSRGAVDSAR
jgi:hypothetical protein